MKRTINVFIMLALISLSTTSAFGQNTSKQNWSGTYNYEISGPIAYTLTIKQNNSCIYEGEGVQTFFKVSCRGVVNGPKYEIFWVKDLDGVFYPSDWLDKSKPIMTLFYKKGKLYTDKGQLNKEVKGGQLLFKKLK